MVDGRMTVQLAGPIGPFLDSVQQRQVECEVVATCEVAPPGPASEERAQVELLRAIRELTTSMMASGALQFKNLSEGADGIVPQVIAASGLAQQGIRVDNLVMTFGVDGRPPKRWNLSGSSKGTAPAAANAGVNVRVGGFNIKAGPGGVDAAGLAKQVGERVKSTLYWYLIAGLLAVVIIGGVGLYLWHTVSKALPPRLQRGKRSEVGRQDPLHLLRGREGDNHRRDGPPQWHRGERARELPAHPGKRRRDRDDGDRSVRQRRRHRGGWQTERVGSRRLRERAARLRQGLLRVHEDGLHRRPLNLGARTVGLARNAVDAGAVAEEATWGAVLDGITEVRGALVPRSRYSPTTTSRKPTGAPTAKLARSARACGE